MPLLMRFHNNWINLSGASVCILSMVFGSLKLNKFSYNSKFPINVAIR